MVAATVRSEPEDLPDLKSPPKLLGTNDQKPQSPSGMFATNDELEEHGRARSWKLEACPAGASDDLSDGALVR